MPTDSTPTTQTRVALVTGGSGGIGRAVVQRLADDGYAVGIHYAGNKSTAETLAEEIITRGGQALAVGADIADADAVTAAFDSVEAAFGGIDAVIHTAGIMRLKPIVDLDLAEFDAVHRTNVRGTFVVDQQAARRVRAGGAIVNFSTSVVGLQFPGYGAYVASKGAVEALTLILARELRGKDITVNAVAPGPTATRLFFEGKDEETVKRLAAQAPLERLGTPEDIAEVTAFLAGPAGHWINGQIIRSNGGVV
ncbi:SDR family oxidoreductase [Streptomyces sp. NPDC006654]|uniref:SDR family oxidoreductase n=1 Tax=Streptomyces sp. NPDC006654 TaxID=3156897 RepID=UPI0033FBEF60